jgi:hypothetical protein
VYPEPPAAKFQPPLLIDPEVTPVMFILAPVPEPEEVVDTLLAVV